MEPPKQPIPLTSPEGLVYAYACGQCRHVAGTGTIARTTTRSCR